MTGAGYRWYETANFCLEGARARGRDLRAHHNLGVWRGTDYLGVGVGAVSTLPPEEAPVEGLGGSGLPRTGGRGGGVRRRNLPSVGALRRGARPRRGAAARGRAARRADANGRAADARARLDEPVAFADVAGVVDGAALDRLVDDGLIARVPVEVGEGLVLTPRGRFVGGGVTAELVDL